MGHTHVLPVDFRPLRPQQVEQQQVGVFAHGRHEFAGGHHRPHHPDDRTPKGFLFQGFGAFRLRVREGLGERGVVVLPEVHGAARHAQQRGRPTDGVPLANQIEELRSPLWRQWRRRVRGPPGFRGGRRGVDGDIRRGHDGHVRPLGTRAAP